MGRPTKLTDHARDRFLQALGAGNFPEVSARYAGFSPASLYRYLSGTSPELVAFQAEVARAVTELELRLVGTIIRAGFTDPRWALIILERRFRDRWAKGGAGEDAMFEDDANRTRTRDDTILLDPELVEDLVPKLLEAAERLRAGPVVDEAEIATFEDDEDDDGASDDEDDR
jgi:hypothetical protein